MKLPTFNFHLLRLVSDRTQDQRLTLDLRTRMHKDYSNIEFQITAAASKRVYITCVQGKHLSDNYASGADLMMITIKTFRDYVSGRDIVIEAFPYREEEQQTNIKIREEQYS